VIAALAPTLPTDDVVTTRWIERVSSGVDPRVVRDSQGRVAGGLVSIPQGQWFGGRSVSTGAITAVGVAPEHRGRGAASQLMAGLIRELHQRNVALSCLYPATQPVYRSADYERAGQHYRYRLQLPPGLQRDDGVLRARPMLAEDEPAVRAIYNLNARNSTGWFDRSDWFWQRMILHSHRYRLRSYVFEREGSLEAYISFTHEAEPTRRYDLVLTDLRASTADGWRALLAFISAHQSMAPHAFIRGDGVEQWCSLLREQQGFEVKRRRSGRRLKAIRGSTRSECPARSTCDRPRWLRALLQAKAPRSLRCFRVRHPRHSQRNLSRNWPRAREAASRGARQSARRASNRRAHPN
jgi:predicted acetyltransferase